MSTLHDRLRARADVRKHHADIEAVQWGLALGLFLMALGAMCVTLYYTFEALAYADAGRAFCESAPPAQLYTLEVTDGPAHAALAIHVAFEVDERKAFCPPPSRDSYRKNTP